MNFVATTLKFDQYPFSLFQNAFFSCYQKIRQFYLLRMVLSEQQIYVTS